MGCFENGLIECWDGTCKASLDECSGVEPPEDLYTPAFGPFEDTDVSLMEWIYNEMGGEDRLGMDVTQFENLYGDYFYDFNEASFEAIKGKEWIENERWGVSQEGFQTDFKALRNKSASAMIDQMVARESAGKDLQALSMGREKAIRGRGGLMSGFSKSLMEFAQESVAEEFEQTSKVVDLKKKGIDIEKELKSLQYESEAYKHEARIIDLEQEIIEKEDAWTGDLYDTMIHVTEQIDRKKETERSNQYYINGIVESDDHWEAEHLKELSNEASDSNAFLKWFYNNQSCIYSAYATGWSGFWATDYDEIEDALDDWENGEGPCYDS